MLQSPIKDKNGRGEAKLCLKIPQRHTSGAQSEIDMHMGLCALSANATNSQIHGGYLYTDGATGTRASFQQPPQPKNLSVW